LTSGDEVEFDLDEWVVLFCVFVHDSILRVVLRVDEGWLVRLVVVDVRDFGEAGVVCPVLGAGLCAGKRCDCGVLDLERG
jgi:hypothetical protein